MRNLIFVFSFLLSAGMNGFAASENGKFTVAFWGDSRSNSGSAFERICGYLIEEKGKTVDVHWQNGDFTQGGSTSNWEASWNIKNVREACVKDYFFMCTSNHDAGSAYQGQMTDLVPGNGTTDNRTYYFYKSWEIPGSRRKVHLLAWDLYFGSVSDQEQIDYFTESLKDASPDDWIFSMWHAPTYGGMTYKSTNSKAVGFTEYLVPLSRGGDGVLNGHAHQYRRTHVLNADGSVLEFTGGSGTEHVSPEGSYGLVHIVNGRGGVFSSDNAGENWEGNAFAPTLSESDGLITLMEFEDNRMDMRTVRIGSDYAIKNELETWSWTRGDPMPVITDTTAPVVTVAPLTTSDGTPQITGTIDDPSADISVEINGRSYDVVIDNETWSIADGVIDSLAPGTYDVIVTATDSAGNVGTDISAGELVIEAIVAIHRTPEVLSLARQAVPIYFRDGEMHIEISFDIPHAVRIVDLEGREHQSFTGTRHAVYSWGNESETTGVFYVVLKMSGQTLIKKVAWVN